MFKFLIFSCLISYSLCALDLKLYTDREVLAYSPKQEGSPKKPAEKEIKKEEEASGKLLVEAAFLFWKARTSDSMYAVSSPKTNFALPYRSSLYEISFPFDPGFKFGLGWRSNHDQWTINALYTDFKTNQRASTSATDLKNPAQFSSEVINAILPGQSGMIELYFQKAVSYYSLGFQDIFLALSRPYEGGKVVFTPEIALEGIFLKGFQSNTYSGGATLGNNYLRVKRKNHFAGIGPETGLTMNWGLLKHWSFEQSLKFSLLLGHLKSSYSEDLSNSISTFMNLTGTDHRLVPHTSTTLGLAFDSPLKRFFTRMYANLLFEGHFLWNFNQKITFGRDMNFENLYLYGVTFNLGVDY